MNIARFALIAVLTTAGLAAPAAAQHELKSLKNKALREAERQVEARVSRQTERQDEARASRPSERAARPNQQTEASAAPSAPPTDEAERSFYLYGKPAFKSLDLARQLANAISDTKDLKPFEQARRELGQALDRLREMRTWKNAAESPTVRRLDDQYRQTFQQVYAAAEPLLVEQLAAVECPRDVYQGADQASLHAAILAAWKKAYPEDEVLAVRFHMEASVRKQGKTWREADKTWVQRDNSTLCVSVIVRTSPKIATIYPAYVYTDNLDGTLRYGTDTKTGGHVIKELLAAKVTGAGR